MVRSGVEDEILRALRRIIHGVDMHSRVLAQTYGLTGTQALILKELSRQEGASVGQLARQVSLSPATVTDVVARLERRGLVRRSRSDVDRRRVDVNATAEALELLRRGPSLLQGRFLAELEQLAEWEQTAMLATLQRIAAMMAADRIDAAPMLSGEPVQDEEQGEEEVL